MDEPTYGGDTEPHGQTGRIAYRHTLSSGAAWGLPKYAFEQELALVRERAETVLQEVVMRWLRTGRQYVVTWQPWHETGRLLETDYHHYEGSVTLLLLNPAEAEIGEQLHARALEGRQMFTIGDGVWHWNSQMFTRKMGVWTRIA